MPSWLSLDLPEMFSFHRSPLEMYLRTSMVYLMLCALLRIVPKRHAGKLSPSDLLVIILIGGAATTALEMAPMSVLDVLIVVGTILFWSYTLDWIGYYFPRLRPWLEEPPTRLIENGQLLPKNMRREMVTEEELLAQLRNQGVRDLRRIQEACLETDGSISVVPKEEGKDSPQERNATTDSAQCQPQREEIEDGPCRFSANGQATAHPPVSADDPAVLQFLQAAAQLQDRLHAYQESVRQIREALSRHGVRLKCQNQR